MRTETAASFRFYFFILSFSFLASFPVQAHKSTDVNRGLECLKKGLLEDAESSLQKAKFQDPDDPRINYDLGIVLYKKRNYANAAAEFESCAKSTNDLDFKAAALYNLGNAGYRSSDYQRAVEAYQASLALNDDPQTRYNLEQAMKKLKQQLEKQQQKQDQKQDQQQSQQGKGDQNSQQNQDSKQNQSGQQNQKDGQNKDQKSETDSQKNSQADSKQNPDGQQNQTDLNKSAQNTASDTRQNIDPQTASGTDSAEKPQERKDTEIKEEKDQPPPPDVSQRAKGMKNQKINPYLVEKILKQMEEREKEVQRNYRRDPKRQEDMDETDPFFMNSDELRNFFGKRRQPQQPKDSTTPDW